MYIYISLSLYIYIYIYIGRRGAHPAPRRTGALERVREQHARPPYYWRL